MLHALRFQKAPHLLPVWTLSPGFLYLQYIVPMRPIVPAYDRIVRRFSAVRFDDLLELVRRIESHLRLPNPLNIRTVSPLAVSFASSIRYRRTLSSW
jgi:hypothetical protein